MRYCGVKYCFPLQFSYTIDKVQGNTEFYWRYQRYSLVREYFEHLPLHFPPLIIISHVILLFLTMKEKCVKCFDNQVEDENHTTESNTFTRIFSKS